MSIKSNKRVPILIGGNLALDFVNSLYWRLTPEPIEWFSSYEDMISWSRALGIINASQAKRRLHHARQNPKSAAKAVNSAIKLREAIYAIFVSQISRKPPPHRAVSALNQMLEKSLANLKISHSKEGFAWRLELGEKSLDAMLWPIARSAAELLASGDWARVGQCAGEGCGWLFLDVSKNHSRRWCAMEHCGHKTNARLHYHRKRKQANVVKIF